MPKPTSLTLCLFVFLSLLVSDYGFPEPSPTNTETPSPNLMDAIQNHLRHYFTGENIIYIDDAEVDVTALKELYDRRHYQPMWISDSGVRPEAQELLATMRQAGAHGLNPFAYFLTQIILRQSATSPYRLSELELLLSKAFFLYSRDVREGQSDPRQADPDWHLFPAKTDQLVELERALAEGSFSVLMSGLTPQVPMYQNLQNALHRYRKIAEQGGWPTLAPGTTLKPGMRNPSVPLLRERLRISGDFFSSIDAGELYDLYLEIAVRNFQSRHGLEVDGEVGPGTLAALNVPVAERISSILVNLERWRWLPKEMPQRYLLVNMAGFELRAMEGDAAVMNMRVIVGKAYRSTPAFKGKMTHLILNPYWNVPTKLAVEDIIPEVLKKPDYLKRLGIRVFSGWGENAPEVDPATINWAKLSENYFPYHLRQDPGVHNALGRIKFMFPNEFAVYLHDTPHRHLFNRTVRTFSSGCIRVEEPMRLAAYLMKGEEFWKGYSIKEAVDSAENMLISLPNPIPIYLVYWTAWAERDGSVHFRDDIYERDKSLNGALETERKAASKSRSNTSL